MEQSEPFWLDFEHAFPSNTEGKAREIRPTSEEEHTFGDAENIMISSSDHNLETAKKKKNSKAGSKIKYTPKYLTKANPG